jgi:feruloyl esterase
MPSSRFVSVLAVLALNGVGDFGQQGTPVATPAVEAGCTIAQVQSLAPSDTTITAATLAAPESGVPRHCRIDGYVRVPGNTVNFRLGLPEGWNGKFYFQGVGGLGGTIGAIESGLRRGYASASTDTGHEASDPTWGANRAKELDYGHRGTHVTAVAAKALTTAFYGTAPAHAYFNGCSNGGRQALMEVQRYPTDFDGVIAGDPATGTPMQAARAVVFQTLLKSPAHYLPKEKVDLIGRATLAACDATDGLADGLITDPRLCAFTPAQLRCGEGDGPDCLTDAQIETATLIYAGLKTPDGKTYAPPFPAGHEDGPTGWQGWITGQEPPVRRADGSLQFGAKSPSGYALSDANFRFLVLDEDDPAFSWRTFRFPQDLPRLKTMTGILSPLDPNLAPFRDAGGKLLLYHGWADPGISAYGTLDYYDQVSAAVGGPAEVDRFARLFLVPGMHHCSGGPGPNVFDMLPALEAWVEKGEAPARVVASRVDGGAVTRTRPLCPHPQVAKYSGTGSIDDAASFVCQ